MFFEYRSASLTKLAGLCGDIHQHETRAPFEPCWVIVQNNETREWLSLHLARKAGVAANLKFILPSEFLWQLYRLQHDEIPDQLPTDRLSIQWSLFNMFRRNPERLGLIPFKPEDLKTPERLFQFCGQLADVFDQYLVYRPGMMEAWLLEDSRGFEQDERWQAEIWKHLNNFIADSAVFPRRSEAQKNLIDWIEHGRQEFISLLPGAIHVFGLSQKSRPFLDIITSLSRHIDIHFYAKEIEAGSDLYEKWSKPAREQDELLRMLITDKQVRHKVRVLEDEDSPKRDIEIHSCHNTRREVEVLKERILHFLDENKDANADDILIMVPGAEEYAAGIRLIFQKEEGEPALPVSRLVNQQAQEVNFVIVKLLELLTTSFQANDVAEFISLPAIREKFELTEADIDEAEEWIQQNSIYWGLGDSHKDFYSWRKGVNQLISGFAMESGELEVFKGLIPFKGITTSGHARLAGILSNMLARLRKYNELVSGEHAPRRWLSLAAEMIEDFLPSEESYLQPVAQLRSKFVRLGEYLEYTPDPEPISFEIFRPWIVEQLTGDQAGSGRFGHGITVSTYVPYRSVPFRFIAMLGMNEGVFPRKKVRPSFDLIYSDPKPGDRVLKEDDSLLFLESIRAAGKQLHLSYIGQDQKTDSRKLPSILVQQLIDALDEDSTRFHKLHGFSSSYADETKWEGYSSQNAELSYQMKTGNKRRDVFLEAEVLQTREEDFIEINDLVNFFSHPCKYFVLRYLELNNYDNLTELRDRESFSLGGLEKYQLDQVLFEALGKGVGTERIREYVKAAHLIPAELAGEKAFEQEKNTIGEFIAAIDEITGNSGERTEEVSIETYGLQLEGKIAGLYGDTLISYRAGHLKARYLVEHWIKHLILIEAGLHPGKSIYLYKSGDSIEKLEITSSKVPDNVLNTYLEWYSRAGALPDDLNFFPESSLAYSEKFLNERDFESALKKALYKWEPSEYNYDADGGDYFNSLIWRGINPLERESFRKNAMQFWEPFLKTQGGN